MSIFTVFKKKEEGKPTFTYSIDETGLECIRKAVDAYEWDAYSFMGDLQRDTQYLKGVADTLPRNDEMLRIIAKIDRLGWLLQSNITVTEEVNHD